MASPKPSTAAAPPVAVASFDVATSLSPATRSTAAVSRSSRSSGDSGGGGVSFFESRAAKTRLPSIILLFLTAVVGLCFRYWGSHVTSTLDNVCLSGDENCIGFGLVYRLSFGLALYFLLSSIALGFAACCSPQMAAQSLTFFNSFVGWILRFLLYAAALVVAFVMPSDFYTGYVHVARVVSAFLLIIQVAILIDFAYSWNENWMAPEKEWKTALVGVSSILYLGSLAALILLFIYYRGHDGDTCGTQTFFISWTLIQTLAFTVISISNWCEHGALLPSGVMTAYCYFLVYSALSSDPSSCNTTSRSDTAHLVIGLIIGCFSIAYASWSLADAASKDSPSSASAAFPPLPDESGSKPNMVATTEARSGEVAEQMAQIRQQIKFYLIMLVSAMYMSMLLTSWGTQEGNSDTAYDLSTESMWIKIATQWAAVLLYIWSLIAPYVCTSRVWNEQ